MIFNAELNVVIDAADEDDASELAELIAADVRKSYVWAHEGPNAVVARATVEALSAKVWS